MQSVREGASQRWKTLSKLETQAKNFEKVFNTKTRRWQRHVATRRVAGIVSSVIDLLSLYV